MKSRFVHLIALASALIITGCANSNQSADTTTSASLSTASFNFGNNLVGNSITQTVVTVTNTGSTTLNLAPAVTGDSSYSIASGSACMQTLAAGASCTVSVKYDPTTASAPAAQNATLNLAFSDVPTGTPQTVAITAIASAMPVGVVSPTDNPQVALYTVTMPFPGSMSVNFGTDTTYGKTTWTQSTAASGGQISIFVAGMLASTPYHMQAALQFSNGISVNDVDHTFTTGALPANLQLNVTTTTTPGMTPQPGLELLNPMVGTPSGVVVTDLAGNILWAYADPGDPAVNFINPAKMLPNGDLLLNIGVKSNAALLGPISESSFNEIREVNLAGDTVREISINDINAELANASCAECKVSLDTFHHDIEILPNGHWLILGSTTMALSSTTTPPLNNMPPTTIAGDVIVDLDQNLQPVWAWNEFNHLDPNRHPYLWPDWTHTNAVLYSKDDGNFLVSMRHQNWIVKVNYANGTGDGSILWHLGEGGDFTLNNGTDPTDWIWAQHGPSYFSANTTGVFSLGVMDNGDDRIFPTGVTCGASGAPPCLYTSTPVYQIDETAKTATLTFNQNLATNLYSYFGGSIDMLSNGNVEYDLCAFGSAPGAGAKVFEVTQTNSPQTVWTMNVTGTNLYRAFRIPSLYPGVQW